MLLISDWIGKSEQRASVLGERITKEISLYSIVQRNSKTCLILLSVILVMSFTLFWVLCYDILKTIVYNYWLLFKHLNFNEIIVHKNINKKYFYLSIRNGWIENVNEIVS